MVIRAPIIGSSWREPEEFVRVWSQFYKDENEKKYSDNIGKPLTPDRVMDLYFWKNNGRMSQPKAQGVERNVIARLDELQQLDRNYPPLDFLLRFARGGMIWRIFLLHIWQYHRYPIYDQHVHRAMRFILSSRVEEKPSRDEAVAQTYINDYIPFFESFQEMPGRGVDKALFAFGRFLKTYGRWLCMAGGRSK